MLTLIYVPWHAFYGNSEFIKTIYISNEGIENIEFLIRTTAPIDISEDCVKISIICCQKFVILPLKYPLC